MPVPARHILIPVHDFSAGGTELIAFRLARRWLAEGRDVTVLAGASNGPLRERVPAGVGVEVLSPERPRSTFSRLFLGSRMGPATRALGADAVFIPGNYHFWLARGLKRALAHAPIVAKASNPIWTQGPFPPTLARAAVATVSAGIDRIVAMAPELRPEVERFVDPQRVSVIADPFLDDETEIRARTGAAPSNRPLRLLTVARLERQKDPMLALAVVAELRRLGHAVTLHILGRGPLDAELRATRDRFGLADFVNLAGYVADPRPAYDAADMLLMTSRFEGVPAAIGEALAAGLPFVATHCSSWLTALAARHPALGTVSEERTAAALARAVIARRALPFPDAAEIEAAVGPHRAARAAARYLELFDSLG